jgi:hypothetical protein
MNAVIILGLVCGVSLVAVLWWIHKAPLIEDESW